MQIGTCLEFTEACVLQKVEGRKMRSGRSEEEEEHVGVPNWSSQASSILSCIPCILIFGIPTFEHKPLLVGSLEFLMQAGSHTSFCFFDFTMVVESKLTTRIGFGRKPAITLCWPCHSTIRDGNGIYFLVLTVHS